MGRTRPKKHTTMSPFSDRTIMNVVLFKVGVMIGLGQVKVSSKRIGKRLTRQRVRQQLTLFAEFYERLFRPDRRRLIRQNTVILGETP